MSLAWHFNANGVKLAKRRHRVLAGSPRQKTCPRGRGRTAWLAIFPNLTSLALKGRARLIPSLRDEEALLLAHEKYG